MTTELMLLVPVPKFGKHAQITIIVPLCWEGRTTKSARVFISIVFSSSSQIWGCSVASLYSRIFWRGVLIWCFGKFVEKLIKFNSRTYYNNRRIYVFGNKFLGQ